MHEMNAHDDEQFAHALKCVPKGLLVVDYYVEKHQKQT
jgi:hypothetical protein